MKDGFNEEIKPAQIEGRIESVLNANLLTNFDTTLIFMKTIEGSGWLENLPKDPKARGTFEYVMKWLQEAGPNEYATTLYGWGGGDRYEVRRDGSVSFKKSFSTVETLARARGIGFPIID